MNIKQTSLFTLFAAVYCFSTLLGDYSWQWLPKIIPILMLLFIVQQKMKTLDMKKGNVFILGLIFCLGGDVFLAVDRENLFVFGLGSFLVGHLFYIYSLVPIMKQNKLGVVLLAAYGAIIMTLLLPELHELTIPVVAYMMVLLAMTAATMLSKLSNVWLILGGVSFTISDSLIGLNKFLISIPYSGFFIMLTYYLAQYALVKGFMNSHSTHLAKQ